MRFAYADPPYIGQAKRHYADHPDYAGEVDHANLIERLVAEYPDGWALSASSPSLAELLPLCPKNSRVMAWVKPNASFKAYPNAPNARLFYAWEPVILWLPSRRPDAPVSADWVSANRVQRNPSNTRGSKPQAFCYWLFDAFGMTDDDILDDIFPGSGAVSDYLEAWRRQSRFAVASRREDSRARRRGGDGQLTVEANVTSEPMPYEAWVASQGGDPGPGSLRGKA